MQNKPHSIILLARRWRRRLLGQSLPTRSKGATPGVIKVESRADLPSERHKRAEEADVEDKN